MRLLNDTSQMHNTSFIHNGKEWGEGKIDRKRESESKRIKSERQSVAEKEMQHGS